jgi:hypothetical protein
MMAMVSSTAPPQTLQVPGEPGQTVTIRRLGRRALKRAARHDATHDAAMLIRRSVLAWDPPRTAPPADGSELQRWLAREILTYSSAPGAARG